MIKWSSDTSSQCIIKIKRTTTSKIGAVGLSIWGKTAWISHAFFLNKTRKKTPLSNPLARFVKKRNFCKKKLTVRDWLNWIKCRLFVLVPCLNHTQSNILAEVYFHNDYKDNGYVYIYNGFYILHIKQEVSYVKKNKKVICQNILCLRQMSNAVSYNLQFFLTCL